MERSSGDEWPQAACAGALHVERLLPGSSDSTLCCAVPVSERPSMSLTSAARAWRGDICRRHFSESAMDGAAARRFDASSGCVPRRWRCVVPVSPGGPGPHSGTVGTTGKGSRHAAGLVLTRAVARAVGKGWACRGGRETLPGARARSNNHKTAVYRGRMIALVRSVGGSARALAGGKDEGDAFDVYCTMSTSASVWYVRDD